VTGHEYNTTVGIDLGDTNHVYCILDAQGEVFNKGRLSGTEALLRRFFTRYPETNILRTVPGVGSLTSLAYILTLEQPQRFAKSRDVPCYLGLIPRKNQSGNSDPQLRISKAGNSYLRRLLVGSAQSILGPFGKPNALRQWGIKLAERGGKNAKNRAIIAVACKLAALLHRLWTTGEEFNPFPRGQIIV